MSDTISLTDKELGALFGDTSEQSVSDDETRKKEFQKFEKTLQTSTEAVKTLLSTKLSEEVECDLSSIDIINGVQAEKSGSYYVVDGNFTNNGICVQYTAYPSEFAFSLAKAAAGIEEMQDSLEEMKPHLLEVTESILQIFADELSDNFSVNLDDVIKTENLSEIEEDAKYIRVIWQVGTDQFFQFFSASLLNLLQEKESQEEKTLGNDAEMDTSDEEGDPLLNGEGDSDFLPSLTDEGEDKPKKRYSSLLGSSDSSESIASLGEELLKDSQTVSSVKLPEFDEGSRAQSSAKKEMSILFGVNMDVTVELGQTKMRLEEILELNRGSIIELRKLAGEPLDVRVNNKLIAKGEVVVIDENFGVRIIEIISPEDRLKEIN